MTTGVRLWAQDVVVPTLNVRAADFASRSKREVVRISRARSLRKPGFTMATVNAVVERGCSMLVHFDRAASSSEIREALESGGPEAKAEAMKKAIAILLSGEQMPQIFITIVRFVLPSDDKYVQKLLLLYMEIIEKTDASGKLLPEMILICQNLRNNLQHPNEFLRGATLRFLCRINEAEILEPLIPSIVACLEHRHSFVRRNAVLCMDRIYQMPGGDILLQDAPETIERFLNGGESDLSTRRNAFLMLYNNDQERAVLGTGGPPTFLLAQFVCVSMHQVGTSKPCQLKLTRGHDGKNKQH